MLKSLEFKQNNFVRTLFLVRDTKNQLLKGRNRIQEKVKFLENSVFTGNKLLKSLQKINREIRKEKESTDKIKDRMRRDHRA